MIMNILLCLALVSFELCEISVCELIIKLLIYFPTLFLEPKPQVQGEGLCHKEKLPSLLPLTLATIT